MTRCKVVHLVIKLLEYKLNDHTRIHFHLSLMYKIKRNIKIRIIKRGWCWWWLRWRLAFSDRSRQEYKIEHFNTHKNTTVIYKTNSLWYIGFIFSPHEQHYNISIQLYWYWSKCAFSSLLIYSHVYFVNTWQVFFNMDELLDIC